MAGDHPATQNADLANCLHILAVRLAERGRREGLAALEEAVERYQQLAAGDHGSRSQLAASLSLLGNWCDAMGQTEKAHTATCEAERLYRQLVRLDPDTYTADLAAHLLTTATRATSPHNLETIPILQEAANHYRHLAHARPEAYRPQLAACLAALAGRLNSVSQWAEALSAIEQSIALYRQLADTDPATYRPLLAATLQTMARQLGPHARLIPLNEAAGIYRGLPETHRQDLAVTLHTLAAAYEELDRTQPAATARAEANTINEQRRERPVAVG
jgi:hypothetical protein